MKKWSLPTLGTGKASVFFGMGCLLVLLAVSLFTIRLADAASLRARSLQLGDRLTELKTSIALLTATIEAERFYGSTSREAFEEQASVYVLPERLDTARVIKLFSSLTRMVSVSEAQCTVSRLTFDDREHGNGTAFVPAHLTLSCNAAQTARILSILGYTGNMIVADALGSHASEFLLMVQEKAPVSLSDAYTLLHTDIATYAASPEDSEGRLLGGFSVQDALDLKTFLLTSGLADARTVLAGPAEELKAARLWPLPLLSIDSMTFNGMQADISLKFLIQPEDE
jgi:hypothetical protein